MTEKLRFDVESVSEIDEQPNSQFATAKIQAFITGLSRNATTCNLETLKRTASTIYEKPIIFEYDSRFGDFGTHNPSKTVPAGFVVPGSAEFEELSDGRVALSVYAKIWKKF